MSSLSASIDDIITVAAEMSKNPPTKILIDVATSSPEQPFTESSTDESINETHGEMAQRLNSDQEGTLIGEPTNLKLECYDADDEDHEASDTDLQFHRTILQSHVISVVRPPSKESMFVEYEPGTTAPVNENDKPETLFGFPDSSLLRKNKDMSDLEPIELKTATNFDEDGKDQTVEVLNSALANMAVTSIINDDFTSVDEVVVESAKEQVVAPVGITPLESSTPVLNPVSEALLKEPKMKAFKIISPSKNNFINNTAVVSNSTTIDDSWISHDYNSLFGVNSSFAKEINLSKSLRFSEDKTPKLLDEEIIYISTRIINPGKIFKSYFKDGKKRNVYIDLILNNNGHTIFLQILKFFTDYENESLCKINDIFVRISASTKEQIRFVIEKLQELNKFYCKVKVLGLFSGLHVYSDNDFSIKIGNEKLKLPYKLEKLCLATGLNLTDFIQLPYSIKHIGLYNVGLLNFSKFNLNKKLDCLHISNNGEQIQLIGRQDNFPKGLLDLKEIKFDSSIVINPNFDKFSNLINLSIRNLNFATTRQVIFPSCLKKLEFIDCLISSHISSFPDSLRNLSIKGGKWNKKKNCNLTWVQKLLVNKVDVKDLYEKLVSAKSLINLEIIDCQVESLQLPFGLKSLKLFSVDLNKSFADIKFPIGLETIVLDNNNISLTGNLVQFPSVKSLRLTNNGVYSKIDLDLCGKLQEVNLYDNQELLAVEVPKSVKSLNVANTKVGEIIGDNLTKLNLNGCTKINWDSFVIPSFVSHLTIQGCGLNKFEYKIENNVKVLNIANNFINKIDLNKFSKVQDLDLSNNQLESLGKLPSSLKSINAGNNNITHVDLKKLQNLEWLELSNNNLEDVTRIKIPTSLLTLLLNNDNLGKFIHSQFELPSKLCHLELNGCNLVEFDQILPSTMLSLCCCNNQLNSSGFKISFTRETPRLKYLDLRSNQFNSFNFNMVKRIELAEINLSGNLFEAAPKVPNHILSAFFV
ncbi:hypothetical protein JA1_003868 [Spathaspora sp. JA1]|nr:hypothetical protein JA1_003868 [Spathaspora sp. JA1]